MLVYNRELGKLEDEPEYKSEYIDFLYTTLPGRVLLRFVSSPLFSNLKASHYKSSKSKRDIEKFVREHNIEMSSYDINSFNTFNDFFIRKPPIDTIEKLRIHHNKNKNELISPADAKLIAYDIDDNLELKIKNTVYSLDRFIGNQDKVDLDKFKHCKCLVYRLSTHNIHRYYYIDDGKEVFINHIKGRLHTVRPIAEHSGFKVFTENCREITIMKTEHLGDVIQVEVGALLVGKIVNEGSLEFKALSEKGYFEFGGSTIIQLIEAPVIIDEDILEKSRDGIETKVSIGEKIGFIRKSVEGVNDAKETKETKA